VLACLLPVRLVSRSPLVEVSLVFPRKPHVGFARAAAAKAAFAVAGLLNDVIVLLDWVILQTGSIRVRGVRSDVPVACR
jgi:hypothetical protein